MNCWDRGFRPDGPRHEEPRGFVVGPMPQPSPRPRIGALQEMSAGPFRQAPMAQGRMDPVGDMDMDHIFAAADSTTDGIAGTAEKKPGGLDSEVGPAGPGPTAGDVMRDFARTWGHDQPRCSCPTPSEPQLKQVQGRGLSSMLGQLAAVGTEDLQRAWAVLLDSPFRALQHPWSLLMDQQLGWPKVSWTLLEMRWEHRGCWPVSPTFHKTHLGETMILQGQGLMCPSSCSQSICWVWKLVQFNVCAQLGQWDDFVKMQAMAGLMTGKAITTYCSLSDRDCNSFTHLVSAFTLKFQERHNVARAKRESRTRQLNEKVQDLASDIWNLTCKLYPDFPMDYREQICVEALKRALDVQLRLR